MSWLFKDPVVIVTKIMSWLFKGFKVMRISTILGTKMAHLSWTKFFWYKPLLFVSSTYWPFPLWKIFKNSYSGSWIRAMHQVFWIQNGSFAPNKFFLENFYYDAHLPISPFHCLKLFKKSSIRSWVMRMCNFCAQNGSFPQIRIFSENLFMSLVSFIHAYLHAKNQSQILIY